MPITETTTPYGLYWRYDRCPHEPEAFRQARGVAGVVAYDEAKRIGKNFFVAVTSDKVCVLPRDHPDVSGLTLYLTEEFTPEGDCIRHDRAELSGVALMLDNPP
jgi:hypothetical protein